jgi:hypothetical protein
VPQGLKEHKVHRESQVRQGQLVLKDNKALLVSPERQVLPALRGHRDLRV